MKNIFVAAIAALYVKLSVGWLVSQSKDLFKKLTIMNKILSLSTNPFLKFSNIFINFHRPTDKVTYW